MCPVPFYDVNFEHLVKVPPVCHFSPNITGSFPLHYKETFSFMLILKSTTQQRVIFLVYLVCSFFFVSLLNMCVHQGFIIGPLQFTTYVFFFCEFFHFCGFNHQSYLSTQILCWVPNAYTEIYMDIFTKRHLNIPLTLLVHHIICPTKLETCE